MTTADAVDRETAWLTSVNDSLPALTAEFGGPFDVVQAYYPRTPNLSQRVLYVLRARIQQPRIANVRLMAQYPFRLIAEWPLLGGPLGDGSDEGEQRAFDAAIDLVIQRISDMVGNKTHGGRFLSVAENPRQLEVDFTPVEQTMPEGFIQAIVTYSADDPEAIG